MTNQTNLDFLFQMTALPERTASSAASSNGARGGFDGHLLQASSTSPSHSKSELRPNAAAASARGDSRSISQTDGHSEQNNALSKSQQHTDDEAIDHRLDANEAAAAQPAHGAASETEDDENRETPNEDESDEVAVALASGEAIRQSQTAVVAKTQSSDQIDAEAESAPDPLAGEKDTTGSKSALKADPTSLSGRVEAGSGADSADDSTQVGRFASEAGDAAPPTVAASETGKPASRTRKEVSNAQQSDASSAATADGTVQTTEEGTNRLTNSTNSDQTQSNAAGANLDQADRKARPTTDARGERKDGAEASANRVPVPEVIAAQSVQQTSTAANADGASESNRSVSKPVGATSEPLHESLGKSQRGAGKNAQRTAAGKADDLPRVDAARFVGRVAKAVQVAHERGGALQLRLSPPELGSLRLELTVQNGVMTASLETESPAARQVLLDHLPALRDRLAEQNIRVERFDVDVRQEQQSGGGDSQSSQQRDRQHQSQHSNPRHSAVRASESEVLAHETHTIRPHATSGGLNVLA